MNIIHSSIICLVMATSCLYPSSIAEEVSIKEIANDFIKTSNKSSNLAGPICFPINSEVRTSFDCFYEIGHKRKVGEVICDPNGCTEGKLISVPENVYPPPTMINGHWDSGVDETWLFWYAKHGRGNTVENYYAWYSSQLQTLER